MPLNPLQTGGLFPNFLVSPNHTTSPMYWPAFCGEPKNTLYASGTKKKDGLSGAIQATCRESSLTVLKCYLIPKKTFPWVLLRYSHGFFRTAVSSEELRQGVPKTRLSRVFLRKSRPQGGIQKHGTDLCNFSFDDCSPQILTCLKLFLSLKAVTARDLKIF